MQKCEYCGREVADDNVRICPGCGGSKLKIKNESDSDEKLRKKEEENQARVNTPPVFDKRKMVIAAMAVIALTFIILIAELVATHMERKTLFVDGIDYYNAGQMEESIEALKQIPTFSMYYKEAQRILDNAENEYIGNLFPQINDYVNCEDYPSALETVDYALYLLPDNQDLTSKRSIVSGQYKNYAMNKSAEYINDNKYPEAIQLLASANDYCGDDELESNLNELRINYRNQAIDDAHKKLDKEGYYSAMKILRKARKVVGSDDVKIQRVIDQYKLYKPVMLSDEEPYEENEYVVVGKINNIDNYGGQYDQDVICADSRGATGIVSYYLGGEYSVLEGRVFVPYEQRNYPGSGEIEDSYDLTSIKIYGDDDLLYTAPKIYGKDKPYNFVIDVQGVEFLEIWTIGGEYMGPFALGESDATMCLTNLAVAKR